MTIIEAVAIMMGGGGDTGSDDVFENVSNIQYIQYGSTYKDSFYDGSTWTYGDEYVVPNNSIVICRIIRGVNSEGKSTYQYLYHPFQILINNLDTSAESVYGLLDIKNNKEYLLEVII